MGRNYFMHRIKGGENAEPFAYRLLIKENYLTIGWSDFSCDSFVSAVKNNGLQEIESKGLHSRNRFSLFRFLCEMHSGDIVVVPLGDRLCLCEITDDAIKTNESIDTGLIVSNNGDKVELREGYLYSGERYVDIGFYRKVKIIDESFARNHVSEGLYRRLKIMQTNSYLNEFSDEIDNILLEIQEGEKLEEMSAKQNTPVDFSKTLSTFSEEVVKELTSTHSFIKDLPFNSFKIPEYQRSYKWKQTQVNQLVNDVITFTKDSDYRLGTIVLYNSEIVDGQQRLVTLSLIIAELQRNLEIAENAEYKDVFLAANSFLSRTSYENLDAQNNVKSNLSVLRLRHSDLDSAFAEALLKKCYFTIVRLPSIPEAFQFFDSQNSRGKHLDPHDLLKAFHLREVGTDDDIKLQNVEPLIDEWQDVKTEDLVGLFLTLYRIRQWSRGNSARSFERDDIKAFKGITATNGKHIYPSYLSAYYLNLLLSTYDNIEDATSIPQNAKLEYPFQIDAVILNGKRFFEMIIYYLNLFQDVKSSKSSLFKNCKPRNGVTGADIIDKLSAYDTMNRVGDYYVRNLFDSILLYYIDKFGTEELDRAIHKIFTYSYGIRLTNFRVSVATIDDPAIRDDMFKTIRDAATPSDFLNTAILPSVKFAENASADLMKLYKKINMIK